MAILGTDVLAATCILCGAATGGGLTLAFLGHGPMDPAECATEAIALAPSVVVRSGSEGKAIVISQPRLRVHAGDCGGRITGVVTTDLDHIRLTAGRIHVDGDRIRAQVEEAMARAEAAQARAEESRIRVEEIRLRAEDSRARVEEIRLRAEETLKETEKGGRLP